MTARKLEPQSYNGKELDATNTNPEEDFSESFSDRSPRISDFGLMKPEETKWANLDFWPIELGDNMLVLF